MKIIEKPDTRICCKKCKCVFEYEDEDIKEFNGRTGRHTVSHYHYVSCPFCKSTNRLWNNTNDNNEEINRIRLLQYDNLRKYFRQLINDVLGEDYYNMAMDVYECDRICCEDIASKIKKR